MLSICDIIVSQKTCNGEKKKVAFLLGGITILLALFAQKTTHL